VRVLHVLDRSLPIVAGYTARAQAILEQQAALGLEPRALTSVRQGTTDLGTAHIAGATYERTPSPHALVELRGVPALREAFEMLALGGRILAVHREAPVELIHAHSPVLCGLPAAAAARRLGVPVVYEIRAFWEDAAEYSGRGRRGSPRYAATRALETRVASSVDVVVAICEGIRRDLVARGIPADRVAVVPNGVDSARFAPKAPDEATLDRYGFRDKIVVAYIGSLFRYEGVPTLLHALRRMLATRDDVRGLIVGSGEAETELREQHHRLGLGAKVVLTGAVPPAEAERLYTVTDVLAYPRERHRLTELVTPLKPLEAMSMGKVVVGSDVGGLKELIHHEETGLLFHAGSVAELEHALGRAVDHASLRRRLGEQARAHVVERRDWRRLAARYLEVYGAAREAAHRRASRR
jgi:PEP-CTERM/exosortase A-associated glycosyltransferase